MPAAHFLGLRPRLVFAQYPDDLLLAEATPFHRPSPFSGDGLYLISAEFSGCRPEVESPCEPNIVQPFQFLDQFDDAFHRPSLVTENHVIAPAKYQLITEN